MTKDELAQYITSHFEGKLIRLDCGKYDPMFRLESKYIVEVARALRDDENLKFDFLCCLAGVDTGEHFEAVYSLSSVKKHLRIDFKVILPYDKAEIDSVKEVWPAANWYEREMWELYGINVNNHGNLTRFLLPDDWNQGFPMRKDWDAPDFKRLPEV